jgi:DNA-binding SARP family transcriptional activator
MTKIRLPYVENGLFHYSNDRGFTRSQLRVGSPDWFSWLAETSNQSFSVLTPRGTITIRRQAQSGKSYWYAYLRASGQLHKAYVGKGQDLDLQRIGAIVARLTLAPVMALSEIERIPSRTHNSAKVDHPSPILIEPVAQLTLLGRPSFEREGIVIDHAPRRLFALVAFIATASAPPTREHIAHIFWPEASSSVALHHVRNLLWQTGQAFGKIVRLDDGFAYLAGDIEIDLRKVEHTIRSIDSEEPADLQALQRARQLISGPFLGGTPPEHAPAEFEEWMFGVQSRIDRMRARIDKELISRFTSADRVDDAIHIADEALMRDPLDEAMHLYLIRALWRRDGRSAALRQFHRLERALADVLDIEPSQAAKQVKDSILSGDLTSGLGSPALLASEHDARFERLDLDIQQILQLTAINGGTLDREVLALASELSGFQIDRAIGLAIDTGILVEEVGGLLCFRNARFRDAIVQRNGTHAQESGRLRLAMAMRAVIRALPAYSAARRVALSVQAASHYSTTQSWNGLATLIDESLPDAVDAMIKAIGEPGIRSIVDHVGSASRLEALAESLTRLGRNDDAESMLHAARLAYRATGKRIDAMRVSLDLSLLNLSSGNTELCDTYATQAIAFAGALSDEHARSLVDVLSAITHRRLDRIDQAAADAALRSAASLRRMHHSELSVIGTHLVGHLAAEWGHFQASAAAFARTVPWVSEIRIPLVEIHSRIALSKSFIGLGRFVAAEAELEAATTLVERSGLDSARIWSYRGLGDLALAQHRPDTAEAQFASGLDIAREIGNIEQTIELEIGLAKSARSRGDITAAFDAVQRLQRQYRDALTFSQSTDLQIIYADVMLAAGESTIAEDTIGKMRSQLSNFRYPSLRRELDAMIFRHRERVGSYVA